MSRKLLFLSCFSIIFIYAAQPIKIYSQINQTWCARYNNNGSNNNDGAVCIKTDDKGNVYTAGFTTSDPNQNDYIVIKYNKSGEELWNKRYNGPGNGNDQVNAMCIDNSGNVYVTGLSMGGNTGMDIATLKFDSKGDQQWAARYNGSGNSDGGNAIEIDNEGNVYVAGSSIGEKTGMDIMTIKYSPDGIELWSNRYNNLNNTNDYAVTLKIDKQGNVITAGYSDEIRFNDGVREGMNFTVIKYNNTGTQLWVQRFNGEANTNDEISAMALDNYDNIYVTGYTTTRQTGIDYCTVKYTPTGTREWIAVYNGPGNSTDQVTGISIDNGGNVLITGFSTGSGTNFDYATVKYSPAGVELWTARYNDANNSIDEALAISTDALNSVYVTGYSWNGTDNDYTTIKYNQMGEQTGFISYNGPANSVDQSKAMCLDNAGNIYVTGNSIGVSSMYDISTIKYSQTPPEEAPVLTSPPFGSSGLSLNPMLEWKPVKNSDYYKIQVSKDSRFSYNVIDTLISISNTQYKVNSNQLGNNTQYYWRVNPVNIMGEGGWSPVWTFSVLTAPDSPELLSPRNGSAGVSITPMLEWKNLATAASYRLQIARDYNFSDIVQDVNIGQPQFAVPSGILNNNSVYFWRVNATNVGGTVPWSDVWELGIGNVMPPQKPTLIEISDGSKGQSLTPTLSWSEVISASKYHILIASDLNFTSIAIDEDNLTSPQYKVAAGKLSNNTTYYWKVTSSNIGGTGQWSYIWTFTTLMTGMQRVGKEIPKEFKLYDNYPDPFTGATAIRFDMPKRPHNTEVSVIVYDLLGREVSRLLNEKVPAGSYIVNWDASNYTRGYYLYQVHAEGYVQTKRMLLIK